MTSVLRTQDDVKRLRRRNGNASANSAHFYGTTFDVSWKRFQKIEDEDGRPLQDVECRYPETSFSQKCCETCGKPRNVISNTN